MRIFRDSDGLSAETRGAVAALGNFDGVHKGHQSLIAVARAEAAKTGAPVAVMTFEPHPRHYFQPDAPGFRLTLAAEKARILETFGVDYVFELSFDQSLARLSAEDFISEVLGKRYGLGHLVVGEDFRFGRGRAGDATMLRNLGAAAGFGCTIQHLLGEGGHEFSSTALRVLIEEGRVLDAARMLGRWHTVSGQVQKGDQRGRELGYPTANLVFGAQLVPRFGVYACEVTVRTGAHAGTYPGVASIGARPTFGENVPNFEVHLFDFEGDLYGAEISAGLVRYLRPELKFDSVETLIAAMDRDSAEARAALAAARVPG